MGINRTLAIAGFSLAAAAAVASAQDEAFTVTIDQDKRVGASFIEEAALKDLVVTRTSSTRSRA